MGGEIVLQAGNATASFLAFAESERARINEIKTVEDGETAVDGLSRIKKMLEAVDEYHAVIQEFCSLEAEVVIQITKICDFGSRDYYALEDSNKQLFNCVRFFKMHEDRIAQAVETCGKIGCSIFEWVSLEQRSEMYAERIRNNEDRVTALSEKILDDFDKNGIVRLSVDDFLDKVNDKGPNVVRMNARTIAKGVTESTRDKLLRRGAVGIGDCQYVKPTPETIERAILIRAESITHDMHKLAALCNQFSIDDGSEVLNNIDPAIRELCLLAIEQFSEMAVIP